MMVALKNALNSIKSYKLRVFTAMVWIILGITSVIVVSSIGNGLEKQMDEILTSKDDRKGKIEFWPTDYNISNVGLMLQPFGRKEIEAASLVSGVERVGKPKDDSSSMGSMGYPLDSKGEIYIQLYSYNKEDVSDVLYGRSFSLDDEDRNVAIIPETAASYLYEDPSLAIGKPITLGESTYEIVGVIAPVEQGGGMFGGGWMEEKAYIPKTIFNNMTKQQWGEDYSMEAIEVKVAPGFNKDEVLMNVVDVLQQERVKNDGTYSLSWEENQVQELEMMKNSITRFTGMITFVALVIGGIGIMNIMYMSVIERKREIGIRRAIGAKPRNIIVQFVTESVVITSIGGVFGIIFGVIVASYLGGRLPFAIMISPASCVFAAVISIFVGIIFGVIPAYKASKVDPIKAIRG
ncbi:MAG: ABC transporter permease [Sarcina sp.]